MSRVEDASGLVRKGLVPDPKASAYDKIDAPTQGSLEKRVETAVEKVGVENETYFDVNTGSGKYNYKMNRKEYNNNQDWAIHDALSLLSYDDDFRAYFYANQDKYVHRTGDMNYTVDDTIAFEDYKRMLTQNPNWSPDPAYQALLDEKANYALSLEEAKDYYNQTLNINLKAQNDLMRQLEAEAQIKRQEQIDQLKALNAQQKIANETLLEYLQRTFAGAPGSQKSWEDFFSRVVPRTLQAAPFMGTLMGAAKELKTGRADPMFGFPFYTTSLQMQQMLAPMLYSSKSGKTLSWQRPIYNIRNYYPRTYNVRKPKKPKVKRSG